MSLINLGKLIDTAKFEKYITEADKLETVIHVYGSEFNIPDYTCWMDYRSYQGRPRDENFFEGTISFTRNTLKNPILKEMAEQIVLALSTVITINPRRVHLMKTTGNIYKHKDEAGRLSCINIGLKNTNSAVTRVSNDNNWNTFDTDSTEYVLEDGVGYLLNTNILHSVSGDINIPRYLITYGFNIPFKELIKQIDIQV